MEPTDHKSADGDHSRGVDDYEPTFWYTMAMSVLYYCLVCLVLFYVVVISRVIYKLAFEAMINVNDDKPMTSSVELVGFKGLEPALAPGVASPTFNLLVHVSNGRISDQCREGGSVKVSYAGVPLAHGRTPSFRLGAKAAVTMAVNATSKGVGIPEDLFRLMSAERRLGMAQLEIGLLLGWAGWESYAWGVDLDG